MTGMGPGCLFWTHAKSYPTRGNPRVILELQVSTVLSICYNFVFIYLSVCTGLTSTIARKGNNRDIGSQCDPMLHSEDNNNNNDAQRSTTHDDGAEERGDIAGRVVHPPPSHRCVLVVSA